MRTLKYYQEIYKAKMASTTNLFVVSILIAVLTLSGCVSVKHKLDFESGYVPESGTMIEIGQVTNETGKTFEINVEQMLTDALTEKLRNENLLWVDQEAETNRLVLLSKIVEYAEGDAFKRWLLPGWGATILTVHGELRNGDQLVGTAKARRNVYAGGAYTIGAWKTVFSKVAEDIVDDLKEKIPKAQ